MGRNKEETEKKEGIIFSVEFHPEVEFDLLQAHEFYEEQRAGLGDEFILCAEASLNYISRQPRHFPKIFSHTRHCLIKRFPYGVFYIIIKNTVYVTAIVHLSRNPKVWNKRI